MKRLSLYIIVLAVTLITLAIMTTREVNAQEACLLKNCPGAPNGVLLYPYDQCNYLDESEAKVVGGPLTLFDRDTDFYPLVGTVVTWHFNELGHHASGFRICRLDTPTGTWCYCNEDDQWGWHNELCDTYNGSDPLEWQHGSFVVPSPAAHYELHFGWAPTSDLLATGKVYNFWEGLEMSADARDDCCEDAVTLSLNGSTRGKLDFRTDEDWRVITANNYGEVLAALDVPPDLAYDLEVWGDDCRTVIGESTRVNPYTNDETFTFGVVQNNKYRIRTWARNQTVSTSEDYGVSAMFGTTLGDPDDDSCQKADTFPLTLGAHFWGALEFPGDRDWHSVTAPTTDKMLVAMHVTGDAEQHDKNYDLEVWSADCSTKLGHFSYDTPDVGDERLLFNAVAGQKYSTHVFGRRPSDYEPTVGQASYHQWVSIGSKVNGQFTVTPPTGTYDPTPQPNAPAGVYTVRATFTNRPQSNKEFYDLTFDVATLTGGNKVLNADGGPRIVGATVSIPNRQHCPWMPIPSYLCAVLPAETFTVEFRIGLQRREPFDFFVDLYGNEKLPPTAHAAPELDLSGEDQLLEQTGSEQAIDTASESFQFDVLEEQLNIDPSGAVPVPVPSE